jgi:hypothetical protein
MQQLELGVLIDQDGGDLPRADDIRVSEAGPVMRVAGNCVELVWPSASRLQVRAADRCSTSSRRGGDSTSLRKQDI